VSSVGEAVGVSGRVSESNVRNTFRVRLVIVGSVVVERSFSRLATHSAIMPRAG
jgi:hypothetical protein